ncbi:hypothetical protein AB3329_06820 [Streptococcus sp. H31]|uniref:hypothetical protein n=1 Tax=Streptococcus huangxiaojuni TaxID=3237239 RepID=UPI0034A39287
MDETTRKPSQKELDAYQAWLTKELDALGKRIRSHNYEHSSAPKNSASAKPKLSKKELEKQNDQKLAALQTETEQLQEREVQLDQSLKRLEQQEEGLFDFYQKSGILADEVTSSYSNWQQLSLDTSGRKNALLADFDSDREKLNKQKQKTIDRLDTIEGERRAIWQSEEEYGHEH